MKLLFKLLRKGVNPWHLTWFALANLVGAVIVLLGIQAYRDAGQVLGASDSVLESDILVLSKPVSAATTLANARGAGPRSFSESEIENMSQDMIEQLAQSIETQAEAEFHDKIGNTIVAQAEKDINEAIGSKKLTVKQALEFDLDNNG